MLKFKLNPTQREALCQLDDGNGARVSQLDVCAHITISHDLPFNSDYCKRLMKNALTSADIRNFYNKEFLDQLQVLVPYWAGEDIVIGANHGH